ncbi:MAG: pilus assembly protein PilM [Lachnospiraceae bacterium]|nr:pilus assembly protein PilM [Lachnospiraceae bacterium]
MAKTILGVDIGYDNMKLALVQGREVLEAVSVPMPKNMVRDGHIVSDESMGEMIRTTMKENGIRTGAAAFVIPDEAVFVKNVVMPVMTEEQLVYNLPFEFRDYITGEIREYLFDYALLSELPKKTASGKSSAAGEGEEAEEAPKMELLAVSVPKSYMEETRGILRKAGMKLEKAAPSICSYIQLIRMHQEKTGNKEEEFCILDLGYQAIRMHMYKGDRYIFTRVLDIGLSMLDEVLADAFSVDIHLAHTYLMTNYEGCQSRAECQTAYSSIAMELMRVLNFYRYSNPDSHITDMWLCGGGAVIEPLRETIRDSLDLDVYPASELVPGGEEIEDCNSFVQAIGMAMEV